MWYKNIAGRFFGLVTKHAVAQKFHFAILRIEVTRASRGLYAIAELLVSPDTQNTKYSQQEILLTFTV